MVCGLLGRSQMGTSHLELIALFVDEAERRNLNRPIRDEVTTAGVLLSCPHIFPGVGTEMLKY